MTEVSPQLHARCVAVARTYLEEYEFHLLDHAVPYADFVETSVDGVRLLFVGSPNDPNLLQEITTCRKRCPLDVVGCDALEVLFGDGYATVELTRDIL